MTTFPPSIETSSNIADLLVKRDAARAALDQVEVLLTHERVGIIKLVRGYVYDFDIKPSETYPAPPKKTVPADPYYNPDYFYRDPKTGEEWDGKGKKRPKFLHGKRKLDEYRVCYSTAPKAAENPISTVELTGNSALIKTDESIDASAIKATVVLDPTASEPEAASTEVLVQDSTASMPAIISTPTSATLVDSVAINQLFTTS